MSATTIPPLTAPHSGMRSITGLSGSLVLLAGVTTAFASAIVLGAYGSEIIHCALGGAFVLLALSAFDFRPPRWLQWAGALVMLTLAATFLAQAIADISQSQAIAAFAYAMAGQVAEKVLGDLFLLWCVLILVFDSRGRTRWLGMAVITVALAVEGIFYAGAMTGMATDGTLKLLYLLIFVWLALESGKRKPK